MTLFPSSRSSLTLVTFASLASLVLAAAACSSTTSSAPAGSSGTSGTSGSSGAVAVSADVCASRCEAKFTKCGADAASAKSNCSAQVCNASPSADQLTCLEGKSCDAIAGAMSFGALCPASSGTSGGTSGATSGGTSGTPTTGVMCGTATCASAEYCGLTYDSSAMAWGPGGCKKVPDACTSKSAADLCDCMSANSGCPTGGVISTKCSQSSGGLSFGCTN